ncbi:MAG: phage tail tape measure protein, partial [Rhodobacteraceae bacterium]|nr:phage tail tape measure protein [Paracoccaceae bacterium]
AMRPVQNAVGGAIAGGINGLLSGLLPAANGAAFSAGRVEPFASGGVVNAPTLFAHRGGLGLMGEAGPEAILPLGRGPDGRLGVRAQGGGRGVNVTLQVNTPDVEGFRRSHTQIAAELSRVLALSSRNR